MNIIISQNFAAGVTHQRREEILKTAAAKKLNIDLKDINPYIVHITTNQSSGLIEFDPTFTPPDPAPKKKKLPKGIKE